MLNHYLKLALRNLWKYRTQSIISVVGLAVGFVCFALANLWIHYEMTYDSRLEGIDRTYLLYVPRSMMAMSTGTYQMAHMLREYPEVEAACAVDRRKSTLTTAAGTAVETYSFVDADSAFIGIYGSVRLLAGNWDFLHLPDRIALTEETAVALFGTIDVLGETVMVEKQKMRVCALLNNRSRHSNFYFGCWESPALAAREQWSSLRYSVTVRLRPGADVDALVKKMHSLQLPVEALGRKPFEDYGLMPLQSYHYSEANQEVVIQFHYLALFSAVGTLIILCALLNYLSLFVMRMQSRVREAELRRVCGSSRGGLFVLFATEYLWVLLLAGLIGMALIEWVLPEFRRLSAVSGGIYAESLLYFAGLLLLSFLFLLPFAWRRRRPTAGQRKHLFSKVSIWLQLTVSVGFIFCVGVLMVQLRYLKTTDIGWERRNTAVMWVEQVPADVAEALNAYAVGTPYIREFLTDSDPIAYYWTYTMALQSWEGKDAAGDNRRGVVVWAVMGGVDLQRFYNLKLVEGDWVNDTDLTQVVVNQTLVKEMGMTPPVVGKTVNFGREFKIVGVVKDFHTEAPTMPVKPTAIFHPNAIKAGRGRYGVTVLGRYLVKYEPGTYPKISADVDSILARYGVVRPKRLLINVEEAYAENLRSEELLMRLLGVAALVCILTAAFGIFSLVSLSCQQRRKEIAIRKVNGARIGNILALFAREYLLLLVLSAVVAFPVGYLLMKRWLESYVEQTPISWWLYAAIFAGTAAVVALCIGWRVWQAARSNPAETIKSE